MKGDIAFAGFMLTADDWHALDAESRAQLIAVATRRSDPAPELATELATEPRRRLAEGTGPHEILELLDSELDELIEPDASDARDAGGTAEAGDPGDAGGGDGREACADDGFEDFSDLNEP